MAVFDVAFESGHGRRLRFLITVKPIRRFGFAAAILLNGILVVPNVICSRG